jgi:hypothetical protein
MSRKGTPNSNTLFLLIMLVSWMVWKERNEVSSVIGLPHLPSFLRSLRATLNFG